MGIFRKPHAPMKMPTFKMPSMSTAKLPSMKAVFGAKSSKEQGEHEKLVDGGSNLSDAAFAHPSDKNADEPHGMRYATEAVGTFFLILVGLRVGAFTTSLLVAALMCMGASVSLAMFNPAIVFAHVLRSNIDWQDCGWYIFSQVIGATTGALVYDAFFGLPAAPAAYGSYSELAVTMAGLVAPTAALCLIHLATLTGESRTQFFGLAVGFTLFACITAYGAGSNLFNPAISIGSYLARGLLGSGFAAPLAELSFLLTGGLAGALAALAFNASSAEGTVGVVSTEFLGTLLATALVITTADSPGGTMAQAVGLGYAALTFFGAEISEAHYNPAVTIAHVLQGSLPGIDGLVYIVTQLLAATVGAFIGGAFYGFPAGSNNVDMAALPAGANAVDDPASTEFIVGTAIGSLTLCLVHLHVLSTQPGNGFFGLAVGFTLLADIVVFASSFNPAIAFGLWLAGGTLGTGFDLSGPALIDTCVLVLLPFVSAVLAYLLFTTHTSSLGGRLSMEAVGVAFIVLALFSTTGVDEVAETFGSAATGAEALVSSEAPAVAARRLAFAPWASGKALSKAQALGLDDGLLLVALTYMAKYVSGAHFSPAVSLAHAIDGYIDAKTLGLTCLTQVVTATATGCLGAWLYGLPNDRPPQPDAKLAAGILFFSFALSLVHLGVVAEQPGNGFFGIAIGFTMFAGILAFGDAETAMFNPAVAIAVWVAHGVFGSGFDFAAAPMLDLAVLVLVPLAASALAGLVHRVFNLHAENPQLAKLAAEGVGTFIVALTLTMATGSVGLMYVAVTYAAARVSGAHLNPAVSLVHYLRSDIDATDLWSYSLAQTGGALLAGLVAVFEGGAYLPAVATSATPLLVLGAETLFAFAICLVHADVLTANGPVSGKGGNGYFGLAMGFTVLAGFMVASSISGGVFNPAIGLALWLANGLGGGGFGLDSVFYYLVAPPIGALIAERVIHYQKSARGFAGHGDNAGLNA